MPEKDDRQNAQLFQQMKKHFSLEEIRTLCLKLNIDFDEIGGEVKSDKIRELILLMERQGRFAELLAEVKAERPTIGSIKNLTPPHHIPYHQNKLFTGREEWLTKLHTALHQEETVAITQALAGLGGVGKTQLALAYCYRHLDDYDLIHWLRADDATTLSSELAELAYRLGLARRTVTDQPALHQFALNWLHSTDQRWLLVYDNADDIQPNELSQFLPKMGRGACLITSRNPNWGTLAQTMRLTHFSRAEAVAFLLGQPTMTNDEIDAHPLGADAQRLAELLGYLPLALEHARAYVAETQCSLVDYAGYFENERDALWGTDLPAPANYDEKTIATTWELAFSQAKQTPGAAALLNLCCFLAPDDIPLNVLMAAARAVHEPPQPEELVALAESGLKLDKAIAALRRYSLLTRDGDTILMHRLVQIVTRDQMPPELRQSWAEAAVNLLLQAWPYDHHDITTWERSGELLPHLLAVADEAEKVNPLPDKTGLLLNNVGFYLHYRASYALALNLHQLALAIDEKALGPNHLNVAIDLNNLAQLLQELGEYETARLHMERSLVIWEKELGAEHPQVAIGNNNLGQLLQTMGEYGTARIYLERALTISKKVLGPDHPRLATVNNNIGLLLYAIGDYETACLYMKQALAISEKSLGVEHPNVARDLNNFGSLLFALGEYEEARTYMERALRIDEKMLGADHPIIANRLNNLALLLHAIGEKKVAWSYQKRAIQIGEKSLGPNHPEVAVWCNNLGEMFRKEGEYEEAQSLIERAIQIGEKALGPEHPDVAVWYNNLGQLLREVGKYEKALKYLECALDVFKLKLGDDHPYTQNGRDYLTNLLAEIGD